MSSVIDKFDSNELTDAEIKSLHLPTNRKQQYWDIVKNEFNNIVKLSLLCMLLCLPFIFSLLIIQPMISQVVGARFDFMGNILIGYPGSIDSLTEARIQVAQSNMYFYILLIIPITLMGPAFAGLFYTLRNMVWGKNITIKVDFWKGLKLGWKQYTLTCFLVSIILALNMSVLTVYNVKLIVGAMDVSGVLALIFVIVSLLFTASLLFYILPQMAIFDFKFGKIVRNSALLTLGAFPYTLLMAVITVAPFLLMAILGEFLGSLISMAMFLCGYIMLALVYVAVTQNVLDKYIFPRMKSPAYNKGLYKPKGENADEEKNPQNKVKPKYVNPKKKKKAEVEITPLAEHYGRGDLEKLQRQKEEAIREMDEENEV